MGFQIWVAGIGITGGIAVWQRGTRVDCLLTRPGENGMGSGVGAVMALAIGREGGTYFRVV